MDNCIVRGDIFYANLNHGVGSEQRGYRPVLVIQNNIGGARIKIVQIEMRKSKINKNVVR